MERESRSWFFNRRVYNYFEYSMPIPIYLLYFDHENFCQAKALYAVCFVAHFLKRLYENMFVHVFSNTRTPVIDLAIDVAYYWGFAAVVGYGVNSGRCEDLDTGRLMWFALWALFEYGNYSCHMTLRNIKLRSGGAKSVPAPDPDFVLSRAFELVSCPNYLYEMLTWTSFAAMTSSWTAAMFASVGATVMGSWAKERHYSYLRDFSDYPRDRCAMFPYLF